MSSKAHDFITLCVNGEVLLDDIDDFVEEWHEGSYTGTLHDFLGMTWEEYSLWVADNDILPFIVTSHKDNVDINVVVEEFYAIPLAARADSTHKAKILMKWLKQQGKLD